jgi:hypothetical protein
VLRVRLGDYRGVPRRVDFLRVQEDSSVSILFPPRGKTTYDENVNSALRRVVRCTFRVEVTEGKKKRTHCAGVGHDVGDVLPGIHRTRAVRALLRNILVIGHDEREALAVDDVPVERIELRRNRKPKCRALDEIYGPTWTQDIASSVRSMSDNGKLRRS